MRKIAILFLGFALTGCTSIKPAVIIDGVLGHYPHYDAQEYNRAVDIEIVAKYLAINQPISKGSSLVLDGLVDKISDVELYASGRPYNKRILHQIELLKKVTVELQERERNETTISGKYYDKKMELIVKLADTLRTTIGGESL